MKLKSKWLAALRRALSLGGDSNALWYINGAEALPPPLDAQEEARVLAELGHSPEAAERLIRHNLRLVVYISKRFDNVGTGIEDLISIGTIGLIKAVNTYKPEKKIKLATYASRCIENEILMYIRKNAHRRGELSIDEPLNTDWDGNELLLSDVLGSTESGVGESLEKSEDERTVREAVATLSEREREIIELRYGLGGHRELTQKEVAERLGISQSYISRLEKKIIKGLKSRIIAKV